MIIEAFENVPSSVRDMVMSGDKHPTEDMTDHVTNLCHLITMLMSCCEAAGNVPGQSIN